MFGCVFKDGPESVYFSACNKEEVIIVEWFRGSNSIASVDLIVLDCKTLTEEFSSVSINYVCRNLNVLAHRLVGHAMQAGCNSWVGYAMQEVQPMTCVY
jgi:hypothetical protein